MAVLIGSHLKWKAGLRVEGLISESPHYFWAREFPFVTPRAQSNRNSSYRLLKYGESVWLNHWMFYCIVKELEITQVEVKVCVCVGVANRITELEEAGHEVTWGDMRRWCHVWEILIIYFIVDMCFFVWGDRRYKEGGDDDEREAEGDIDGDVDCNWG